MTKLKMLKRLKETNQTKSLAALLDLLINQVFLMLAILKIFRFFCVTFFLQYEIPKDSSARYYKKKKSKKGYKKSLVESIKIFPEKKKIKSDSMVANDIKIFPNME